MLSASDQDFLKAFYQSLADRPLEPDDAVYEPLQRDAGIDPVERLRKGIEWTEGTSAQLLTGYRGSGKSTELRRLRHLLRKNGHVVLLTDVQRHMNLSSPMDVSDFLVILAAAFEAEAADAGLLDAEREPFWSRFVAFLKRIKIDLHFDIEGAGASGGIDISLRDDPDFRKRLQETLAGHLGPLIAEVRGFILELVDRIRGSGRVAKDKKLVFLVDSLENVRGGSVNAKEVSQSVRTVFADHAEKLRLPGVDTVYSVPVYLRILSPNIGSLYGDAIAEIQLTPVRTVDGRRNLPGFERLRSLVGRRGDLNRLLGSGEKLDPISDACGGHLRDVFRLLREAIKITATVPLDHVAVEQAKQILRRDFLPIAKQDADWLHRIHRTKKAAMDSADDATALARFFDTHLVLAYPDSPTWYDVHPLIVGDVAGPHGSGRPSSDTSAPEPATP